MYAEAGVDVFVRNNEGETLLHAVAKRVYGNMVEADRNAKDVVQSSKFLMKSGLDPMVEDNNQRTALDVAAACGNEGF
jgi:ankyrin repeat protein